MPGYKVKDLRKMSESELIELLKKLREELVVLRMKQKAGMELDHPKQIRNLRRQIARILTILREKQIAS